MEMDIIFTRPLEKGPKKEYTHKKQTIDGRTYTKERRILDAHAD